MSQCYKDKWGFDRFDSGSLHPLIATYLEQDVQGSKRDCDDLLALLDLIETEQEKELSFSGNAHWLSIHQDGVTIENMFDTNLGTAKTSITTFRACILAWRHYLLSR